MCTANFIIASFAFILSVIFYWSRRKFDYWKKKKVQFVKPLPFFGNFKDYILLKAYYPKITTKLCQQFPDEPYVGAFFGTEPVLIIKDPELLKCILVRDFYHFSGREIVKYTHKETATQNLFFTYGDRWKIIRQNLTPLFSTAKMKNIFPLIEKCSATLNSWIERDARESSTVDIKTIATSYTMDCIGSCIFGVNMNTMSHGPQNPFKIIGASMTEATIALGLKIVWRSMWPAVFYGLGFQLVNADVSQFFNKLLREVFASRQYEPSERNDFVDLLLGLHKNSYVTGDSIIMKTGESKKMKLEVDDEFMASNCMAMFAAGLETSSSTLSYTLYELAKNKEAQARAIQDVDKYWMSHERLEYDCISELPYLDACLNETLRMYPVLGVITREVTEDYTLPTGLRLNKGLRVHIPVYYLHHNPEYFPEPEQYRPGRFYGKTKSETTPYTFFPFGEGPRICIGWRFAKMQMLSCLLTVLKRYRMELPADMPRQLQFEPRSLGTVPRGKIRLQFIPRSAS